MDTTEPKTDWQELPALNPTCSFKTFIFFTHVFWIATRHLGLQRPTFFSNEFPKCFKFLQILECLEIHKTF